MAIVAELFIPDSRLSDRAVGGTVLPGSTVPLVVRPDRH